MHSKRLSVVVNSKLQRFNDYLVSELVPNFSKHNFGLTLSTQNRAQSVKVIELYDIRIGIKFVVSSL
ncbi:hypothetical protein QCA50_010793 [Cerrena zonata]|uniref:Uncharacterized protein n=1 Tax=Cerrena zonata TaxID=2478898 RepID=A0AAW0G7L9_9APHY